LYSLLYIFTGWHCVIVNRIASHCAPSLLSRRRELTGKVCSTVDGELQNSYIYHFLHAFDVRSPPYYTWSDTRQTKTWKLVACLCTELVRCPCVLPRLRWLGLLPLEVTGVQRQQHHHQQKHQGVWQQAATAAAAEKCGTGPESTRRVYNETWRTADRPTDRRAVVVMVTGRRGRSVGSGADAWRRTHAPRGTVRMGVPCGTSYRRWVLCRSTGSEVDTLTVPGVYGLMKTSLSRPPYE